MPNYIPIENRLGVQPISLSSAVQNHDLGTLLRARDATYGEGEFIYLLGVVATGVGSLVIWDGQSSSTPTYQTTLAPTSGIAGQPLAVSMSANIASQYGWYQLGGQAVMQTNGTLAANQAVYLAGSGQATTATGGLQILESISVSNSGVPSSGLAIVEIDRCFAAPVSSGGGGGAPNQRRITGSGSLPILSNDAILNVAISAPLTITIPAASGRSGESLTFQDVSGTWGGSNTPTFTPTGGDTFDGLASITGATNYGWIEFIPLDDGVSSGYKIIGNP
jgi:hypothetical protein